VRLVVAFVGVCGFPLTTVGADPVRVGVFNPQGAPPSVERALRDRLAELGYVEGKTLVLDWRGSAATAGDMRGQAADLASKVDLIVTMGTPATRAVLDATTKPVVFIVGDPVAMGFAASLAKPGGNATGVSVLSTELNQKRLELVRELVPRAQRVSYLTNASSPLMAHDLEAAKRAAHALRIQLLPLSAQKGEEIDAIPELVKKHASDAIVIVADLGLLAQKSRLSRAVREARIPAIFPFKEYHEAGVLMSYGPNFTVAAQRAANYVDRIIKGAKPGELPIDQMAEYELIIDLRAARELHINIAPALLVRANEVMQ
jgi:putative ABC transport system substrate-binding protein